MAKAYGQMGDVMSDFDPIEPQNVAHCGNCAKEICKECSPYRFYLGEYTYYCNMRCQVESFKKKVRP